MTTTTPDRLTGPQIAAGLRQAADIYQSGLVPDARFPGQAVRVSVQTDDLAGLAVLAAHHGVAPRQDPHSRWLHVDIPLGPRDCQRGLEPCWQGSVVLEVVCQTTPSEGGEL